MNQAELARWAGQMVACSPNEDRTDATLLRLISEDRVGGVLLFKRSCKDSETTRQLVEAMQRRAETPLLVMIDQEGGRVMRLQERLFRLPSARELASYKPEDVEKDVYYMAMRLREIGVNVNLAPVLDVDTNPKNPIIGDRAFGSDPETVWRYANAYWKGLRKAGLLGCGKHFPGHGDTFQDSHLTLPSVSHDRERLDQVELAPFRAAIEAGMHLLMVAHVVYDALDPETPASLSRPICTDLLRGELGFQGVLMADDLEMKAIHGRYSTEEIVRGMLNAGIDLFPICHSYELAEEVLIWLQRLVRNGDVPPERLKESHDRIVSMKNRLLFKDPYS